MSEMNPEDQELFLEMLLKLDGTHESIKAASKWCRANSAHHEEIVRMWFFAFCRSRSMQYRLDLFHLASDILFTVEASSIQYCSSFIPQLIKAIPFVRGDEIKIPMKKLFLLWRKKGIYNKDVMDVFEKSLRNRNKVIDMAVFQYDRKFLFSNLRRIEELRPACDILAHNLDNSPNFENCLMLSSIKERRACQHLLSSVDATQTKMNTLVAYLEEIVHLLKMTTVTLDVAANREQNGIEETKLKMVAYGKHSEKILSLSHTLESKFKIVKADLARPSPASPEPEVEELFSRRGDMTGPSRQPPIAPLPSMDLGICNLKIDTPTEQEIFTRRDSKPGSSRERDWTSDSLLSPGVHRAMTPRRDEWEPEKPSTSVVYRGMAPRREEWASDVSRGPLTSQRDPAWTRPSDLPRLQDRSQLQTISQGKVDEWDDGISRSGSLTPRREEEWNAMDSQPPQRPRGHLQLKINPWALDTSGNSRPQRDDEWSTSHCSREFAADEWRPRTNTPRGTWMANRSRSTPSRDEWLLPNPDHRRSVTPSRDEWRQATPNHRRSVTPNRDDWDRRPSSWGTSTSEEGPVYSPRYTGLNAHEQGPNFKRGSRRGRGRRP